MMGEILFGAPLYKAAPTCQKPRAGLAAHGELARALVVARCFGLGGVAPPSMYPSSGSHILFLQRWGRRTGTQGKETCKIKPKDLGAGFQRLLKAFRKMVNRPRLWCAVFYEHEPVKEHG